VGAHVPTGLEIVELPRRRKSLPHPTNDTVVGFVRATVNTNDVLSADMSDERLRKLKRPWTEADDDVLRSCAASISPLRMAIRLRRTKNAVVERASKLGVSFPRSSRRGRPRLAQGQTGSHHPD